MLVEHGEIPGFDGLTERYKTFIFQCGAHCVNPLTSFRNSIKRWLDTFGRSPFATLLVDIQTLSKTLTTMTESTGLRLIDFCRI